MRKFSICQTTLKCFAIDLTAIVYVTRYFHFILSLLSTDMSITTLFQECKHHHGLSILETRCVWAQNSNMGHEKIFTLFFKHKTIKDRIISNAEHKKAWGLQKKAIINRLVQ